jgi:serine/threonine protein kinase
MKSLVHHSGYARETGWLTYSIDVWALGVLLYKLCYYTTPFEEHGPLAILHVQYKIPPYPVYSQGLIGLISKRPLAATTVIFECLHVPQLRYCESMGPNDQQYSKSLIPFIA